jgi:hypothetical protein
VLDFSDDAEKAPIDERVSKILAHAQSLRQAPASEKGE